MTIPFLDFFKKLTGRGGTATAEPEPPVRTAVRVVRSKKPESERLSKTVMPNVIARSSAASDPFRSAAATNPRATMPLELGAHKITTSAARPRAAQLPPALARALEPKVERTISLRVGDLVDVIPAGFIKPVEILDADAVVSLKASEIEKGMPDKHPTISLPSLYQQVPEIFLRSVRPDDDTRVELPYEKVLDQFQNVQIRDDQVRDPAVPHVDTPILTATIQDSERFGTKIEPIETTTLPGVPVKPATARSIADAVPDATPAQPETAVKTTASGKRVISLHSPDLGPTTETSEPPANEMELETSSELSPNGTGVSASERVPASSGPPVPTPLPFTPELPKLSLKLSTEEAVTPAETKSDVVEEIAPAAAKAPVAESASTAPTLKLKLDEAVPKAPPAKVPAETIPTDPRATLKTKANETAATVAEKIANEPPAPSAQIETEALTTLPLATPEPEKDVSTISLSLKSVLKNLPAFQINGDVDSVPDNARITFPLGLIEPQLAKGRVSIGPDVFQEALPAEHRGLFQIDAAKTSVAMPLEEVLTNLPPTVLKLRDDQEYFSVDKEFETPFLAKAQEDARRFGSKAGSTESGLEKPVKQSAPSEVKQPIEKIDPKEIVAKANGLAGVKACAITFSDGLSLAGELPDEFEADGLCAMAPSMLERIAQHLNETKLGQLAAMTLYVDAAAVSFFARGNVCLTALHDSSLTPEIRAKLAELAEKLSRTYAQPEKPNVDH